MIEIDTHFEVCKQNSMLNVIIHIEFCGNPCLMKVICTINWGMFHIFRNPSYNMRSKTKKKS